MIVSTIGEQSEAMFSLVLIQHSLGRAPLVQGSLLWSVDSDRRNGVIRRSEYPFIHIRTSFSYWAMVSKSMRAIVSALTFSLPFSTSFTPASLFRSIPSVGSLECLKGCSISRLSPGRRRARQVGSSRVYMELASISIVSFFQV